METKLHQKEVQLFGTLPNPYRDHNWAAPEKPHKVTTLHGSTNLVKHRLHIYHYSHWVLSEMKHYSNQTRRALSIICPYASYSECLVRFDLVTLHARRVALCSKLFESIRSCPDHKLVPVLPPKREHRHNLRQSRAYAMPRTHTNRFKNTFIPSMCT